MENAYLGTRQLAPRRVIAGVCLLVALLVVPWGSALGATGAVPPRSAPAAASALLAVSPLGDWTTYLFDASRSGHTSVSSGFSTANVSGLAPVWEYPTGGFVGASTTVANGTAYVGSWDGYEYAITAATGQLLWRTYLNLTATANCPTPRGVSSTATVVGDTLYVGGGGTYWYALNASTGATLWKVYTGNNSLTGGHYNWASPLIYGGRGYIGIASDCDAPLVQGQLLEVDLGTHQVVHTFNTSTTKSHGASIWGSPAIDPSTGLVYVATGNGGQYGSSMLAFDATTLALQGNWSVPANQSLSDGDFGDTPTIFEDAAGHDYVGVANKNGIFYAFNASHVASGPVWERSVAVAGDCPECGQGSISPATFDGSTLYLAGGQTTIGGIQYPGSVRAVVPATGQVLWQVGTPGAVLAGLASANGMLFDAAGAYLQARNAASGALLLNYNAGSTIDAAPSIAEGRLFDSTASGVVLSLAPTSGHWLHLFTPPGVSNASMAYDAADGYTVEFGGCASDLCPSTATWTWHAGSWTNRTPTFLNATNSPSPREDAALAYDAQDGYVVLFGGFAPGVGLLSDSWKYHAGTWTLLSPGPGPSARAGAALAYDPSLSAVVLFGGTTFSSTSRTELSDTWEFSGGKWTSVPTPGKNTPPARDAAGLAYYPTDSTVLLFGGRTTSGALADTWELGTKSWSQLSPASSPAAEYGAGLSLDNSTGKDVLYGGHTGTSSVSSATWTYSSGTWAQVTPSSSPSARDAIAFAYDAADKYLVLYGGAGATGQPDSDTWKFSAGAWTHVYPSSPGGAREGAGGAYDAAGGYLVVFGGRTAAGAYLVTTLEFTGIGYTTVCSGCTAGKTEPSARAFPAMAYDPVTGQVVLFGGIGSSGLLSDTWAFSGGKWTNITPAGGAGTAYPAGRVGAALAYDATDGYLLLYGGRTSSGASNATWTFQSGSWTHLAPSPAPSPREGAALSPDPSTGGLVLFGGNDSQSTFGDTWQFAHGNWTPLPVANGPSARSYAGATNLTDLAGSGVLLFGGYDNGSYRSDAWEFTPAGWFPVYRSPSPGARYGAVVQFDPLLGVVVLYGGATPNAGTLAAGGDTWTFGTEP